MPTAVTAAANTVEHDNYATSTSAATKTPATPANYLLIENMDATDNVLVSFDGGSTFKTIKPNSSLRIDVDKLKSYDVKSSANTPAVEALYGFES